MKTPISMPCPPLASSSQLATWQREPAEPLSAQAEVHLDLFFALVRYRDELAVLRRNWRTAESNRARAAIEDRAATVRAEIDHIEAEMAAIGLPARPEREPAAEPASQAA